MRFAIDSEISRRGRIFKRRMSQVSLQRQGPAPLMMLAHGDSWFDYPLDGNDITLSGRTDIIQHLDPDSTNDESMLAARPVTGRQFIIHNVSHWGDATTDEMSLQGQTYMRTELQKFWDGRKPDAILFSGGGNDIVGADQFCIYLDYAPPPPGSAGLNEERFAGALAKIEASYKNLFAFRDKFVPGVPIFAHCYDFAIPNNVGAPCNIGPWLYPSLNYCGYPDLDAGKAIVRRALTLFKERLAQLAASPNNKFFLIDTQGILTDSEWGNELHPTADGFAKIAAKFRVVLNSHFSSQT
jgi:hypothetical protein